MLRLLGKATRVAGLALVFALASACDDGDDNGNADASRGTGDSGGLADAGGFDGLAGRDGAGGSGGGLGSGGSGGGGSTGADAADAPSEAGDAATDSAAVSDAPVDRAFDGPQVSAESEILGVLDQFDTGEVDLGGLAGMRAIAPSVVQFANLMVTAHTTAKQRLAALSTQTGIAVGSGPLRLQVQQEIMSTTTMLSGLTDVPTFEGAYIQSQITMHMRAVFIIDQRLMPAATTASVRSEVMTHRATAVSHLIMARNLQRSGDGGAGGP
jgi:putative membrane protein